MILRHPRAEGKGWYAGPWDTDLDVAVGYANTAVDEPHRHDVMFEIYLVAHGTATAIVDGRSFDIGPGDVLVVEPGETHTFTNPSRHYFHFVVQTPCLPSDKSLVDPTAARRTPPGLTGP